MGKSIRGIADAAFVVATLAGNSSAATELDIAYHWAPVLFQDTATQGSNISLDFVTRVDFDGNFRADDNWDHQPDFPLSANVYYDLVETETHIYLFYSFFHPRDWEQICLPGLCHENDLENVRLVVEKDASDFGTLLVADLQAHGNISSYVPTGSPVGSDSESIDGTLSFEGSHVRIFLEAHGHGPQNCGTDPKCGSFPGGDGVVYRPSGVSEVPASENDADVGYALLSGYDELWTRRSAYRDGGLWKSELVYLGSRLGARSVHGNRVHGGRLRGSRSAALGLRSARLELGGLAHRLGLCGFALVRDPRRRSAGLPRLHLEPLSR